MTTTTTTCYMMIITTIWRESCYMAGERERATKSGKSPREVPDSLLQRIAANYSPKYSVYHCWIVDIHEWTWQRASVHRRRHFLSLSLFGQFSGNQSHKIYLADGDKVRCVSVVKIVLYGPHMTDLWQSIVERMRDDERCTGLVWREKKFKCGANCCSLSESYQVDIIKWLKTSVSNRISFAQFTATNLHTNSRYSSVLSSVLSAALLKLARLNGFAIHNRGCPFGRRLAA